MFEDQPPARGMYQRKTEIRSHEQAQCLRRLIRPPANALERGAQLDDGLFVQADDQVVEILEHDVQRADGITDAPRDLAHRQRGGAVFGDDVAGRPQSEVRQLLAAVFVASAHSSGCLRPASGGAVYVLIERCSITGYIAPN